MSPARRRRIKRKKRKKRRKTLLKIGIWVFLVLFLVLLFKLTTKYWSSDSKLTMAVFEESGDIRVSTFDPEADTIRSVIIPADTEVKVARQLGTWRIKSVWRLGEDEGFDGKLLAETVTKQFKIPVFVWAGSRASGFSSGDAIPVLKSAIAPYKTNLGLGDRLKLAAFSLGVKNFKREEVDLADSRVLEETELVDGSMGFRVVGDIPASIVAIYSDPLFSSMGAKTHIIDATTSQTVAEEVGEIIEVVGLKVASIEEVEKSYVDCSVSGKDRKLVVKVSKLLSCSLEEHDEENFDLTILLGEEFADRF